MSRTKKYTQADVTPVEQTLINMIRMRAIQSDIAKVLGLSHQSSVMHRKRNLIAKYGEALVGEKTLNLLTSEVAKEYGVSITFVQDLCENGKLPARKQSKNSRAAWVISRSKLHILEAIIQSLTEFECKECDVVVETELSSKTERDFCSEECRLKYREKRMKYYYTSVPKAEELTDWRKDLVEELVTHVVPIDEQWLTLEQASDFLQMPVNWITWLRIRNILSVQPNPVRPKESTFAFSELQILSRVYREHANAA